MQTALLYLLLPVCLGSLLPQSPHDGSPNFDVPPKLSQPPVLLQPLLLASASLDCPSHCDPTLCPPDCDDCPCCSQCVCSRTSPCSAGLYCYSTPQPPGVFSAGNTAGVCVNLTADCASPTTTSGCVLSDDGCQCYELATCTPLRLFQYDDKATCQRDWDKLKALAAASCLHADCNVTIHQPCPDDSIFVPSKTAPRLPPNCCVKPGVCKCNLKTCPFPACPPTHRLHRTRRAAQIPGDCCSEYVCRDVVAIAPLNCSNVACPPALLACPRGSVRPEPRIPEGKCCPVVESCLCAPLCPPVVCPEDEVAVVTKRGAGVVGRCCDEYDCVKPAQPQTPVFCFDNGFRRVAGELWHDGPCQICSCRSDANHKEGVRVCEQKHCPSLDTSCTRLSVDGDECCSVCAGCRTEDGRQYEHGSNFTIGPCQTCHCSSGKLQCQTQYCSVDCDAPVNVDGQCCPICDEPAFVAPPPVCPSIEHCDLRCANGLQRDAQGCFLCDCRGKLPLGQDVSHVSGSCSMLDNCDKHCAHGYVHDLLGCPLCACEHCPSLQACYKHCLYGFQNNQFGCPICKCKASPASAPFSKEQSGQPACDVEGKQKDTGEWWHDGCRHCYCSAGQEYCSLISCPPPTCSNPVRSEGECCPSCSSNSSALQPAHQHTVCFAPATGQLYVEGETWSLGDCVECTCHVGHVLCEVKSCAPVLCSNSVQDSQYCCPKCMSESPPSSLVSSSTSKLDHKHCTDSSGQHFSLGSTYRQNDCTSCECLPNGSTQCFTQRCPETTCDRPLRIKGLCCPVCLGRSQLCHHAGQTYTPEEVWATDPCTTCHCSAQGDVFCTQTQCSPCRTPRHVRGRCCPICEGEDRLISGTAGTAAPTHSLQVTLACVCVVVGLLLLVVITFMCYHHKKAAFFTHLYAKQSRSGPIKSLEPTASLGSNWDQRKSLLADLLMYNAMQPLSTLEYGFNNNNREDGKM